MSIHFSAIKSIWNFVGAEKIEPNRYRQKLKLNNSLQLQHPGYTLANAEFQHVVLSLYENPDQISALINYLQVKNKSLPVRRTSA